MADARRPKKADYKLHGQQSRDPDSRMGKNKRDARLEAAKAHQIPETATVDDLITALDQRNAIGFIKTTELCNAIVKKFGGIDEFADEFKANYDAAQSQHLKARMFESIVKPITTVNKTHGEENPVDTLSDEDVDREARAMFHKFYGVPPNGAPGANDGRGVAAVPQADGGVGKAPERGPEPVPPPPERGAVPRVQEENPPDR